MALTSPNIVGQPYAEPKTFWPALVGGVAFDWACSHFAVPWIWRTIGILIFVAVAVILTTRVIVDSAKRKVYEQLVLLNRQVLRTREFSLSDFDAIVYQFRPGGDSIDETLVGLRFRSGRRLWIRTFGAGGTRRGRVAEEFAWRLSCDTDIGIDESPS